jgi:hypothetical protein
MPEMDYEPNGKLSLLENFPGPDDTEGNECNKTTSYKQFVLHSLCREKPKSSTSTVGLGPI